MKGAKVKLRCWGGQTVEAIALKQFGFMVLVNWGVNESWDGTPPIIYYRKTAWRPIWRIWEQEENQ